MTVPAIFSFLFFFSFIFFHHLFLGFGDAIKYKYKAKELVRGRKTENYKNCRMQKILKFGTITENRLASNIRKLSTNLFRFLYKNFLRPLLSLSDLFTATLRPLTATKFPRPPNFFYGHI